MTAQASDSSSNNLFPKRIQTERLLLRAETLDDAEAIYSRYASDPQVTRYLSFPTQSSVDETKQFLTERLPELQADGGEVWIIEPLGDGLLLGAIGARVLNEYRVDLGYALARDAWGRGFATEAATAVVETVLKVPSIWRVQATCDVEHTASARVLQKAGLTLEGTLRRYWVLPNRSNEPRDMLCFAKVRESLSSVNERD